MIARDRSRVLVYRSPEAAKERHCSLLNGGLQAPRRVKEDRYYGDKSIMYSTGAEFKCAPCVWGRDRGRAWEWRGSQNGFFSSELSVARTSIT